MRGALALERAPAESSGLAALDQQQAGALAALVAGDLVKVAADAAGLDLCLVGAHYDPAELLRPGWPLHEELAQLSARAPGSAGGRVIAFGTHEDKLPGALAPAAAMAEGPMRLLPFVLTGDADVVAAVGEVFEGTLLELGMADAGTALMAQDAFGLRIEHARYLTVHDLCAMTALQYDHAGLSRVWPLLETALLAPHGDTWLDALPEPLMRYVGGEVRIAMFTPDGWRRRYAADEDDEARLASGYRHFEARQRQIAALLQAHAVPVTFAHCRTSSDPYEELA